MSLQTNKRQQFRPSTITLVLGLMIVASSILLSLSTGAVSIAFSDSMSCIFGNCNSNITQTIIFDLRLPRVLMALFAGAGLALAGGLLQSATNNALADPYLFGIVSGAGLGAVIYNVLGVDLGYFGMSVFAFIGAIVSVLLVLSVFSNKQFRRAEHLVLAGVAVSFMLAAATQFLLYVSEPMASNRIIFWLMGSVAQSQISAVIPVFVVVLVASFIVLLFHRHIDALLLGDEQAQSVGVNVERVRILLLTVSAAITAVVVASCGGIGFVGLMIPHIARKLGANSTLKLMLVSVFLGGVFLLWVDVLARTLINNQEIPLGIITSALGSVFFLMMLKRR